MKEKLFVLLSMLSAASSAFAYKYTIINNFADKKAATVKVTVLWGGKEATSGKWRNTEIHTIPADGQYTFAFKGGPCLNYISVQQPDGTWKKVANLAAGLLSSPQGSFYQGQIAKFSCSNATFELTGYQLMNNASFRLVEKKKSK